MTGYLRLNEALMTPILWALLAVAGSAAVLGSVIAWSRVQVRDLEAASGFLDEAYAAGQRLVKRASTPEQVLDFVEWFIGRAGRPSLARRVAFALVRDHLGTPKLSPMATRLLAQVQALPKQSAEDFAKMVTAGMLADRKSVV